MIYPHGRKALLWRDWMGYLPWCIRVRIWNYCFDAKVKP